MSEDDLIQLIDDEEQTPAALAPEESDCSSKKEQAWKIFVVDDDEQVHVVTEFVLADVLIFDRKIDFLHAYSAEESKDILAANPDIAVILLDVVMETDDAGLNLAKYIREEINFTDPRIILRTGQPGYAPELDVIKNYDINDYRTKSELTRDRLITAIIAAIRSYNQIRTISQSRSGLEKIVSSAADLFERRAIEKFAEGVITQITSLLGLPTEGILCARITGNLSEEVFEVAGAAGRFSNYINQELEKIDDANILTSIKDCFHRKENLFKEKESLLYIHANTHAAVIYIDMSKELDPIDKQLLEAFLINISVAYENVKLFQRLKYIAFYDELTHLPNRHKFINDLDACRYDKDKVAYVIDVDRFSDVNNSLGYNVGDQLLVAISERLQEKLPEEAIFTRVGPDQFGIISHESITEKYIDGIFHQPFNVDEHPLIVTVTIGCCQAAHFAEGVETLKRAYIAVERAKSQWSNKTVFYEENLEAQVQKRLDLVNRLQIAIDKEELQVWYQPQFDFSTGECNGFEALLRWPQQDGSFISPLEFIPVAESSGLIIKIGNWVFTQTIAFLKALHLKGTFITGAVNVSVQQFKIDDFGSALISQIKDSGLDPGYLTLEVTESMALDQLGFVRQALDELKAFGVKVAIDDFGTEFSSLSHIRDVPFDHIKIDHSFMSKYNTPESQAVIEMILLLAKKLNIYTIAEGIETPEQEAFIKGCGCDYGQGFMYSEALPEEQFIAFLEGSQTT